MEVKVDSNSLFKVKTSVFEGPFDLLLFFIKRDELDIYDIPIAQLTNAFLDYIESLKRININVASDFIYTASVLMSIKAKMLLPSEEFVLEEEDPKKVLTEQLIAYKTYKEVSQVFSNLEELSAQREKRKNFELEYKKISKNLAWNENLRSLKEVSVHQIVCAYQAALQRLEESKPIEPVKIKTYEYTIQTQSSYILEQIEKQKRVSFTSLIAHYSDKIALVFSFLAVLELALQSKIRIERSEGLNQFWICEY